MSREAMARCEEIRRLTVEDHPPVDEIRAHAERCPPCAAFLAADATLHERVSQWKSSTPSAPPDLRERVMATVDSRRKKRPVVAVRRLLAAAALLVAALLAALALPATGGPGVVSVSGGLLVDQALEKARDAEREHARAVARLTRAAEPVLARAADARTSPADLARLLAYRDRLGALDDAIGEIQRFLETNPGHPSARTMLLAAYIDKTDLLAEILAEHSGEGA